MRDADPRAEEAGIKTVTARDVAETLEEKSGQREREQDRAATGNFEKFHSAQRRLQLGLVLKCLLKFPNSP